MTSFLLFEPMTFRFLRFFQDTDLQFVFPQQGQGTPGLFHGPDGFFPPTPCPPLTPLMRTQELEGKSHAEKVSFERRPPPGFSRSNVPRDFLSLSSFSSLNPGLTRSAMLAPFLDKDLATEPPLTCVGLKTSFSSFYHLLLVLEPPYR